MNQPRSLQNRLLLLLVGLVAVIWLATAVFTWFDVRHELDELLDGHLAQAAALLVVHQVGAVEDDDREVTPPTLQGYAPMVAFQVFHEGRLVLRSANAPVLPMIDPGNQFRSGFKTVQIDSRTWRVFAAYGAENDMQVYVGEREQSRTAILRAVLRSALSPMLLALPLLALVAWWAVRRGLAPLRGLGRALAERQPQALHPVVLDGAPSEMEPTLAALNGLLGRIGELMETERRFTADAAHELRTPIAAIRAQAQVALGEDGALARHHALLATLEGCDRAARLVQQLLTLSRLETGATAVVAKVDLSALARQVVADLAPQAIHKQQSIDLTADTPCLVLGDATLLAVLVRNLVDNAIRYSPPNAAMHVVVESTPQQIRLKVEDSGSGMRDEDMARLGERFFRVLGTGQGGSGLGWSIVRRIGSAHDATIRVARSATLGGLAVDVVWRGARHSSGAGDHTPSALNNSALAAAAASGSMPYRRA